MEHKKPFARAKYLLALLNPFSRTILAVEDFTGLKFRVYKRDVIGREIHKTGSHEKDFTRWLIDRFPPGSGHFIDVGANLGYFTCIFAKLAESSGTVIAVEPEPDNLHLLRTNIELNSISNVTVMPVALAEKEGIATLNVYKSSNRGRHSLTAIKTGKSIEVPVKTLDGVVASVLPHDARISFIKIDVEGYEAFVLAGGEKTIRRTDALSIEYAPYLFKSRGKEAFAFIHDLFSEFDHAFVLQDGTAQAITLEDCLLREDAFDVIFERSQK